MVWHPGITLVVILCRAAGAFVRSNNRTVQRSGKRIPWGKLRWKRRQRGCFAFWTALHAFSWRAVSQRVQRRVERCCFNIWYFLWVPLCDDQRWRQPWNVSLNLHTEGINERKWVKIRGAEVAVAERMSLWERMCKKRVGRGGKEWCLGRERIHNLDN